MSLGSGQVVWKFEIDVDDEFVLSMPKGAQPLHVAVQGGRPCLWVLVDPAAPREYRTFYVHGTGHPVKPGSLHLGSFMLYDDAFVGHLFQSGGRAV